MAGMDARASVPAPRSLDQRSASIASHHAGGAEAHREVAAGLAATGDEHDLGIDLSGEAHRAATVAGLGDDVVAAVPVEQTDDPLAIIIAARAGS